MSDVIVNTLINTVTVIPENRTTSISVKTVNVAARPLQNNVNVNIVEKKITVSLVGVQGAAGVGSGNSYFPTGW